jgi:O-antigen/teichoic acid export membrane protein
MHADQQTQMLERLRFTPTARTGTHLRILSNSTWNALQQLVYLSASSFMGVILVVALPVEEYGLYAYATALCSIGLAVMTAGLSGLAVKALVQDPASNGHTVMARLNRTSYERISR